MNKLEKEYIQYLIDNVEKEPKLKLILDSYFLNEISFDVLLGEINFEFINSFLVWKKSKRIDEMLNI